MFFSSERLIDTLIMTLSDAMYGKKGGVPIVLIQPVTFNEISLELSSKLPFEVTVQTDFGVPPTWTLNGSSVTFIRSIDIPTGKVYIFFDEQVITITHQKSDDATDKNTLS